MNLYEKKVTKFINPGFEFNLHDIEQLMWRFLRLAPIAICNVALTKYLK
jgi:hypothetical protein